ncbi:MAG: TRAP transporter substrate-binding protein [Alphaproteobacteria bacterium]|nr:TRAP transporter substrate-binding protein [Alphaproteobacteria bacterium]
MTQRMTLAPSRRAVLTGVAGLGLAGGAGLPALAQQAVRWQMPTPYPAGNFHTRNITTFVEEVKTATRGGLEIVVHPGGSLLPLPQIRRNVQTGDVQIGEVFLPALENEDPIFGADSLPFIVTGYEAAERLLTASRPVIAGRLQRAGLRLLFSVAWPPQGLYAARTIDQVEDLRGLRFRSYGPSAARFGELVGATISTIQAAELSQALATGRVNSMITSAVTGVDSKVWETDVKVYYDIQAWLPKNAVLVNDRAFRALPEAMQTAVLNAAAEAERRGWQMSREAAASATEELRRNGVQTLQPSPRLTEGLRRIGATLARDWEGRAGADGAALLAPFKS